VLVVVGTTDDVLVVVGTADEVLVVVGTGLVVLEVVGPPPPLVVVVVVAPGAPRTAPARARDDAGIVQRGMHGNIPL
jgi:hypothetical protein